MTQKSALQFGAGNIGRGFIGVLLSQAGYTVTFVDVVDSLLEQLGQRRSYTVKEITPQGDNLITVEGVNAIDGRAEADVVEAVSQAALITTAVGPNVLPIIAPNIAKGLQQRAKLQPDTPLNIIACENLIDNSKILRQHVLQHLPAEHQAYVEKWVGFPCCVVDKVVTTPSQQELEKDPLLVVTEGHGLLIVDRPAFVGDPPSIEGVQLTDNLDAYVEQKIFTLNTAHAVTAYLGYLKGYEFIHQALQDEQVRPIVLGAIDECSAVLVKRHNLDPQAQKQYVSTVLARFENSTMPDPIVRVAREPKRKLAPNDRLVKPALLALDAGITPTCLATGIAAALLFNHPDDPQAVELSTSVAENGVDAALAEASNLSQDSALVKLVKKEFSAAQQLRD